MTTIHRSNKRNADLYRKVFLDFTGKDLDPDMVTDMLNIEPDSFFRRGEPFGSKGKTTRQGYWSRRGRPRGAKIETQIKNLLKTIAPVRNEFERLLRHPTVETAVLTIDVEPASWVAVASYCFDADLITSVTSLGIDIGFSVHMSGGIIYPPGRKEKD